MAKQSTSVNRPDAADVLELPSGVHKVEWIPDMRFPLCGTFTLYLEDYTVGYLLRNDLLRDKRIKFVGLRQPHPLTPSIELRVQAIDAAVDAHTNTVGSLPSRGDAVGVSGSSFDADDGIGHAATLGAMDPESGVTFG